MTNRRASRDAAGTGPTDGLITLAATPVNDAPQLSDSNPSSSVSEDAGAPVGQVGTTVADLLIGFSDVDVGSARGVAVTFTDTSKGTWWYSIDDGSTWQATGIASAAAARLIGEIGGRVYFQPSLGQNGSISGGLTIRAWDMTTGTNGGTADTASNGGTTAFSSATDIVSVFITPENDAPVLTVPDSLSASEDTAASLIGVLVSDIDAGSSLVTVTLSAESGSLLAVSGGGVTASGNGTGTVVLTGTVSNINSFIASASISFQAPENAHGTVKVRVSVDDQGNTGTGGAKTDEAEFDIVVSPVNDAPTSADGAVTLSEDDPYTFKVGDFAFADPIDAPTPNGLTSIVIETLPDQGALTLDGAAIIAGQQIAIADITSGRLVFTPDAHEHGTGASYSSFTFRVRDNGGSANGGNTTSAQYTMHIDVTGVNDPAAVGGDLTGSVKEDAVTTATGVLTVFDVDAGEASFEAMGDARGAYGTFSFDHRTGRWTYLLDNSSPTVQALQDGEVRQETFTIRTIDGTEQTITVLIIGTSDTNVIDGNNTISGGSGQDNLFGGAGSDNLFGRAGNDRLDGGSGNDTVSGGFGNDRIYGGSGRDRVSGGSGTDKVYGGSGHDQAYGDAGNDRLYGDHGNDRLSGGSGRDTIMGGSGRDTVSGGSGDDRIYGGLGADSLNGGAGRDSFVFDTKLGGGEVDTIQGFHPWEDTILLDNAIFKKVGGRGTLDWDAFQLGDKALDADVRILYDFATGALLYDADGNGSGVAVKFAKIDPWLWLTYDSFRVI